jgi:structural maintenance of chromosome 3 (chondroitin sulfate proteoglycan 6)
MISKKNRLEACTFEKDALYSKRGRWERFKNTTQRNSWLKKEIESLNSQIGSQNDQVKVLSQEIVKGKIKCESLELEKSRVQADIERTRSEFDDISYEYENARLKRNKLDEKRK